MKGGETYKSLFTPEKKKKKVWKNKIDHKRFVLS